MDADRWLYQPVATVISPSNNNEAVVTRMVPLSQTSVTGCSERAARAGGGSGGSHIRRPYTLGHLASILLPRFELLLFHINILLIIVVWSEDSKSFSFGIGWYALPSLQMKKKAPGTVVPSSS
jgi:hypothetical protein